MKTVKATKEVHNEHGDLVKIIYHYEDGTNLEKKLFIPATELAKINKSACECIIV